MSTSGPKLRLALVTLLVAGCGSRTPLRTDGGAPFVDDDPWLKTDGAAARPPDAARADGRAPDGPTGAVVGNAAEQALGSIAKRLWEQEPDPRHLALARAGEIRTGDDLQNIVREMLKDPRSERGVGGFFRWWLRLDELAGVSKDPQLFPLFPKLAGALAEDVVRFGVDVTLRTDARFTTLMTTVRPFQDPNIAALVGDQGDDPTRRSGLLARPGFLALYARADRPSPVRRGLIIRQRLMCDQIPPSPAGVDMTVPPQPPGLTNRQHYATLIAQPACVGCHAMFDRIGYGLENYDAVGAYRSVDQGKRVDASGELRGTAMGDLVFNGPVELGKLIPSYIGAQECIVRQWYHYLRGSPPESSADGLFRAANQTFVRTAGDMREVIVTILGATPL